MTNMFVLLATEFGNYYLEEAKIIETLNPMFRTHNFVFQMETLTEETKQKIFVRSSIISATAVFITKHRHTTTHVHLFLFFLFFFGFFCGSAVTSIATTASSAAAT